jgi:hypothetical protein
MVTRKPVKPTISTSMPHDANPLPYPATPIDSSKIPASTNSVYSPNLGTSPAFDLIDMDEAQKRPRRDSDVSSNGTWDSPDEDGTPEESELPQPLRIAHGKQKVQQGGAGEKKDELPAALRPGPAGGAVPAKSYSGNNFQEDVQSNPWAQDQAEQSNNRFESNNPYLRSQPTGNGPSWPGQAAAPSDQQHLPYQHTGTSQTSWGGSTNPPAPSGPPPAPPVELPTVHTPADEMSKMSLGGPPYPSTDEPYPAHQAPAESRTHQPPLSMVTERTESFASKDSWEQEPTTPDQNWNTAAPIPAPPPSAVPAAPAAPTTTNQAPPYPQDDFVHQAPPAPPQTEPIPQAPPIPYNNHGHSLIDDDDVPAPQQAPQREAAVVPQPDRVVPAPIEVSHQAPVSSGAMPETPRTQASRQRNEHYSIKHINWKDQSTSSMRRSSILTQNANGPCPLLALVNALVLSTPPDLNTALVETLRTREQVSLGLLLDAVFDELMSGRRGDSAQELPDVSELYSFLLALHTGMNVNPRFITPVHAPRGSLDGHSPDLNQTHPMIRAQSKAGAFEETKEMRLYSTFSIPLIHGWVPQQDSSAYEAFERSAQSFEDAQNIQFVEFELEDKLRAEGLPDQEQLALQDIQTIKSFLSNWPTQLTDYGLQTISRTLKPGQIAILFRNDHFSTVYKEPTFGGLMTLVTDAGYGSHDEIVWESLVDVNGAASELFSGDFRVVSHGNDSSLNQGNSAGGDLGWQTVPARNSRSEAPSQQTGLRINNATEEAAPPLPGPRPTSHLTEPPAQSSNQQQPSLSASEQEDHDLALALQLQEEEEDRQRQADQQRRREQELSEQYISRQDEGRPPAIPPRRGGAVGSVGRGGGAAAAVGGRPAVNRPTENPSADPTAPPSYEQYASDRPYREAGSNATTQQGHPLNTYDALRQQQQQQQPPAAQGRPNNGSGRLQGRRRSSQLAPPGGFPNAGAAGGAAGQPGNGRRPHAQPGTVQAAEEKCCVM